MGYVWTALGEYLDDFSQRGKWQVNVSEFKHVFSLHLFILVYLLWPCQVAEVEFCSFKHAFLINLVGFDQQLEKGVWPGGFYVHAGGPLHPVALAPLQQVQAVHFILNYILRKSFHKYALQFFFSDLERILCVSVLEQVIQLFIVNLEKRTVNCHFQTLTLDLGEQFRNTSWNYSYFWLIYGVWICN